MKALVGGVIAAMIAMTSASAQTQLVTEDIMVKSPDAGIEIFVRNKRPANMTSFRPERTLVYVHGATYPASPRSTSSSMACRGWSTSRRAATTSTCSTCAATANRRGRRRWARTPTNNPPIVRGDTAVKDIGTVVDFVLARRNIPRVNLLGWSWGTSLMATYTTQNNAKVERLVLYAPSWIRTDRLAGADRARARRRPIAWCRATPRWAAGSPACRRTRRRR